MDDRQYVVDPSGLYAAAEGNFQTLRAAVEQLQNRRLLGVHAIGTGATELIHIGQAVLGLRGGLDYFLTAASNYQTLLECYKVAALDAFNKLTA